jgi:hypothetical protein
VGSRRRERALSSVIEDFGFGGQAIFLGVAAGASAPASAPNGASAAGLSAQVDGHWGSLDAKGSGRGRGDSRRSRSRSKSRGHDRRRGRDLDRDRDRDRDRNRDDDRVRERERERDHDRRRSGGSAVDRASERREAFYKRVRDEVRHALSRDFYPSSSEFTVHPSAQWQAVASDRPRPGLSRDAFRDVAMRLTETIGAQLWATAVEKDSVFHKSESRPRIYERVCVHVASLPRSSFEVS